VKIFYVSLAALFVLLAVMSDPTEAACGRGGRGRCGLGLRGLFPRVFHGHGLFHRRHGGHGHGHSESSRCTNGQCSAR
jgi:hypothetical protein